MNKPELLSPAGSLKNMRYAFAYGADALIMSDPGLIMLVRERWPEQAILRGAHRPGLSPRYR